jgi:preprotein translocase subunit SecE
VERWFTVRLPNVDPTIMMGVAAIAAILVGYFGYRHKKLSPIAHEVATELSKVTWPTRQETWYSTIVVIVAGALASVYVGLFDGLWSAFTDLIYKTS